ncbi:MULTISPECIES: beta-ketoacyl synthase N-terminal-like domain-containing protein [unclassified Streptomyces]|uniref:beta-ketoacyl synthase N-terminal-like domain-containing protein n=1 Tax=unclassified Streptomyces TaxID=2593676 RepID=UPI000A45FFC7|nr:beta-ketoacyl synthase N-terminal-like domain-containing protein [Streptomyces sp. CB02400]
MRMDNREILTRFKDGTLGRQQAVELLTEGAGPPPPPVPLTARPEPAALRTTPAGYAVIGIAGRYPHAGDLDAFRRLLHTGPDAPVTPPPGRLIDERGRTGHYLDRVADFDPDFFRLTAREAALTDPQERLFLEVAWQVMEDAGYTGARLDALVGADGEPRSVGVYTAVSSCDYALLAAELWADGHRAMPRSGHGNVAHPLSALLDLRGPNWSVDTADSSFLVALHQAIGALESGECAAALVGAVELRLHPSRQFPGAGEGVGVLLLKPLDRARADGDTVHAVIRSSAVGRTGRAGSTGPAHRTERTGHAGPGGQTRNPGEDRLVRRALAAAAIDADTVTVLETPDSAARTTGRAGAATGVAALTRAVLRLGEEAGRDASAPHRAVVTAGSETGTRACVVVEACPARPAARPRTETDPSTGRPPTEHGDDRGALELILLSAPTPGHLAATARRLADWLGAGRAPDLPALAHALRTGRAALPCRLAVTARSHPELAELLTDFAAGAPGDRAGRRLRVADLRTAPADPLLLDEAPETRAYLSALWRAGRLEQLAGLWTGGVDVTRTAEAADGREPGPRSVPPRSALLPRPLWLGRDTEADVEPPT